MGLFHRKSTQEELAIAQEYVERNRYSGLTRHYDARAIQECIQDTGVHVSRQEAKDIVNTVRKQNGWTPADYL